MPAGDSVLGEGRPAGAQGEATLSRASKMTAWADGLPPTHPFGARLAGEASGQTALDHRYLSHEEAGVCCRFAAPAAKPSGLPEWRVPAHFPSHPVTGGFGRGGGVLFFAITSTGSGAKNRHQGKERDVTNSGNEAEALAVLHGVYFLMGIRLALHGRRLRLLSQFT